MKLLVTGGAGYVGGVCATVLVERGHEVVVLDDLSTGNRSGVPAEATFIEGDVAALAGEVLDPGFDGVLQLNQIAGNGNDTANVLGLVVQDRP